MPEPYAPQVVTRKNWRELTRIDMIDAFEDFDDLRIDLDDLRIICRASSVDLRIICRHHPSTSGSSVGLRIIPWEPKNEERGVQDEVRDEVRDEMYPGVYPGVCTLPCIPHPCTSPGYIPGVHIPAADHHGYMPASALRTGDQRLRVAKLGMTFSGSMIYRWAHLRHEHLRPSTSPSWTSPSVNLAVRQHHSASPGSPEDSRGNNNN